LAAWLAPAALVAQTGEPRDLSVLVGKSTLIDSPVNIERVSVANPALAEAVVASPRELIINGRAAGETSLIIWQNGGTRLVFDLRIVEKFNRVEAVKQQLAREMEGQSVELAMEGADLYLRGTVDSATAAQRAFTIASLLGKPVNLLHVKVPPVEPQILIKVRFADVDRGATHELGANIMSLGALNTIGSTSTGAVSPPALSGGIGGGTQTRFNFTDLLNIFLFRPDLNLAATIRALESKRLLQILAEPNVLAINGRSASFLSGGEFPYPTLQGGGGGLGAVTIQFREFGIRINFTPNMTPRGTLRMLVTPEVSSLDYANGLTFQGFTIPGLATRRVSTEVELEDGQSFAIGGLLDNRMTESLSKIPGLGDIPLLGKLFRTRLINKNNSELVVIVTPEIVRPIAKGAPLPEIHMPKPFLEGTRQDAPRTPGMEITGPVPVNPLRQTLPVEEFERAEKIAPASVPAGGAGAVQYVPVPMMSQPVPAAPVPQPQPGGNARP
jgi:pilus assembly protein CpaC